MKIGVFDSGVGGKSVVNAIVKTLPGVEIMHMKDSKNLPYGSKSPETLYKLVKPIMTTMVKQGCAIIVIACNTVTTTLIDRLRADLSVPFIGIEPMVKPAAQQTVSKVIAVCATPTTLASQRYHWLKKTYAKDIKVLEPDCSDWANMIESNAIDHNKISMRIVAVCEKGADVIVLGCTHYHWIEADIKSIAAKYGAKVLQPEQAVITQLKRVIAQLS